MENTINATSEPIKPIGFENYTMEQKTIDLGKANGYALLSIIPIALINIIPYYLLWRELPSFSKLKDTLPLFMISGSFSIILIMILGINELPRGEASRKSFDYSCLKTDLLENYVLLLIICLWFARLNYDNFLEANILASFFMPY